MSQKLQEYLLETKSNFMLKFDGFRSKKKYTVMLYDTLTQIRTFGEDTESILDSEVRLLKQESCRLNFEELNKLFFLMEKKVSSYKNICFVLSINYENDSLKYIFMISSDDRNERYAFETLLDLEVELKRNF